jgi:hypothetical protein
MKPLASWTCDVCHEQIESVKEGYVVWSTDDHLLKRGFIILHKGKCDPRGLTQSQALGDFLGPDGLATLTSFLSYGNINPEGLGNRIADMDEFIDFFRRVQLPWYEQAREHFSSEAVHRDYDGANEVQPYLQRDLRQITESAGQ